jgi:hypothetical protein
MALDFMSKSEAEARLPASKRLVLAAQRKTTDFFMREFLRDSEEAKKAILEITQHHTPRKK